MRTTIIVIVVAVVILGLGYYFLIYKPSNPSVPTEGSPCSSTGGTINDGTVVNGQCVKSQPSGPHLGTPKEETLPVPTHFQNNQLKAGDTLYVNNGYASDDIYVYSAPRAESGYIIGNFRHSWYGTQPIGTFIEQAGTGWMKINVTSLQIYDYKTGNIIKITQPVFVSAPTMSNKPY